MCSYSFFSTCQSTEITPSFLLFVHGLTWMIGIVETERHTLEGRYSFGGRDLSVNRRKEGRSPFGRRNDQREGTIKRGPLSSLSLVLCKSERGKRQEGRVDYDWKRERESTFHAYDFVERKRRNGMPKGWNSDRCAWKRLSILVQSKSVMWWMIWGWIQWSWFLLFSSPLCSKWITRQEWDLSCEKTRTEGHMQVFDIELFIFTLQTIHIKSQTRMFSRYGMSSRKVLLRWMCDEVSTLISQLQSSPFQLYDIWIRSQCSHSTSTSGDRETQ